MILQTALARENDLGGKEFASEDVTARTGQHYLGWDRQNCCIHAEEWLASNFERLLKVF